MLIVSIGALPFEGEVDVDARATRRGVPAVVIWGGLGALVWAAFTVLTGGGSAHADEQPDGPLDGLTSLVGETVTSVTAPVVDQVVAPVVTHVAAPVVQAVVAPVQQAAPPVVSTVTQTVASVPVVGPAAAPVVQAVSHTAQDVVAPVTDILTDAPVAQITDPILDAVTGLPIVGGLVDDLGARDLVDDVVDVVDDAVGVIGGAAEETVPPILEALDPEALEAGGPAGPGASNDSRPAQHLAATSASIAPGLSDSGGSPALSAQPVVPAAASAVVIGERGAPESTPGAPPGAPIAPTSSAGSGGGASSAHARVSDAVAPTVRAWVRASGASDDALPASRVSDTDVSPD